MRRHSLKHPLLALTLAASLSAAASADPIQSDISGSWVFETGHYYDGCRITGRMQIFQTPEGGYSCDFTTFETCPDLTSEVQQSCTARVQGDQVAIVSQIVSITDQQPLSYGYAPDDWLLTIRSEDRMTGTLESASRAEVVFERRSVPLS